LIHVAKLLGLVALCTGCTNSGTHPAPDGDPPGDTARTPGDGDPTTAGDGDDGPLPYPTPIMEGLIRGVDETFWANMDDFIFNVVAPSDVKLYLTLVAAGHYEREEFRAFGLELIRRPESLFANAVIPLLERYGPTGVIWAVDCMNEPEAMIAGADGNYGTWGATWDEIRTYLAYCADTIHTYAPGIKVSSGSGWHDWHNIENGRYDSLGFDFLDFHYYSDTPAPPAASSLSATLPVIIGECGQASDGWNDTLQHDAVLACFTQAKAQGYQAALSWYYDRPGSTDKYAHVNDDGSWRPVKAAFDAYLDDPALQVGLNLAWLAGGYGHDFGPSPQHPSWGVSYDHADAARVIADYDDAGITLMRLWVFEGQEALPFHVLFDDFEQDTGGWQVDDSEAMFAWQSASHPDDGSFGLAVTINATSAGWYGVGKTWAADARLNLAPISTWRFFVHNNLGVAAGVNLAFVTEVDATTTTFQTRPGSSGGQLWLAHGAGAVHEVSLTPELFAEQWALDTAPDVGVARPSDESLQRVQKLVFRVYLADTVVPVNGELFFDAVQIR